MSVTPAFTRRTFLRGSALRFISLTAAFALALAAVSVSVLVSGSGSALSTVFSTIFSTGFSNVFSTASVRSESASFTQPDIIAISKAIGVIYSRFFIIFLLLLLLIFLTPL